MTYGPMAIGPWALRPIGPWAYGPMAKENMGARAHKSMAGRLLSIWRRSGGVNLADFPVLADLPIWRQLGANLAGPIWREFGRSGWNP